MLCFVIIDIHYVLDIFTNYMHTYMYVFMFYDSVPIGCTEKEYKTGKWINQIDLASVTSVVRHMRIIYQAICDVHFPYVTSLHLPR